VLQAHGKIITQDSRREKKIEESGMAGGGASQFDAHWRMLAGPPLTGIL